MLVCAALAGCGLIKGHAAAAAEPSRILRLDSTVVNLADSDSTAYLRVGVSLALASPTPSDAAGDSATQSVARDTVVQLASAQTSDALLGADGKAKLKHAILEELRQRLPKAEVTDVYFDDFLVQR